MDELYHFGILGQRKGNRRFQNYDGSLTPAGRLRYGVGSAVRGGVFDRHNTLSSKAKRLGNFGFQLAKAKANQYHNTGRYRYNQTKASVARALRGKKANSNIERTNRRKEIDYRTARHMAMGLMREFGRDAAKDVMDKSNERFARRISAGKSYVYNMGLFATSERSRMHVARGVVDLHNMAYERNSSPSVSRYRKLLQGSAHLSR